MGDGSSLLGFLITRGAKASGNTVELHLSNAPTGTLLWTVQLYQNNEVQIPLSNPNPSGGIVKAINEKLIFNIPEDALFPLKMSFLTQTTLFQINYIKQSLGEVYEAAGWGPYDAGFILQDIGSYTINYTTGVVS